jgi:hypothetical protein
VYTNNFNRKLIANQQTSVSAIVYSLRVEDIDKAEEVEAIVLSSLLPSLSKHLSAGSVLGR